MNNFSYTQFFRPKGCRGAANFGSLRKFQTLNPIRPEGELIGPDDQTHNYQSETSYFMIPKLGEFFPSGKF